MMEEEKVIIADTGRPLWKSIIAALCFTISFYVFWLYFSSSPDASNIEEHRDFIEMGSFFLVIAIGFCYRKGIQIRLKSKEFKATFGIGPLIFGQWKKIPEPGYVSVFQKASSSGGSIFIVNLWYDKNKHWELYTNADHEEAFLMGFDLSEQLNIELLNATTPNDYKWIDKEKWREEFNETS